MSVYAHTVKSSTYLWFPYNQMWFISNFLDPPILKDGHNYEKSINWSDINTLLPGGNRVSMSISKAIVSLQIPEVLSYEAIQLLLYKKIWIRKAIASFQTREAIQELLSKKFSICKVILLFQTQKRWSDTSTCTQKNRFKPQKLLANEAI